MLSKRIKKLEKEVKSLKKNIKKQAIKKPITYSDFYHEPLRVISSKWKSRF